ncbi:Cytochrome c oxidase subunit 2 [bacterium HR40]|nr:Cytochrome c oxidase subunit 2 [bacterium HR40]
MNWRTFAAALAAGAFPGVAAFAETGQPRAWQMSLQAPATPIARQVMGFHDLLLVIITLIALFVLVLIAYVVWRFREDRNPTPSRRSHNTLLEVVWTVVPVLILVIIAIPSFKLLYAIEQVPPPDLRIKAIGHQWYWSYVYPDHGNFTFDAVMKDDGSLEEGEPRLLATDNYVVVPVKKKVLVQVTAEDVLHSWAVPSFGVKVDAIPGRLNELWFEVEEPGTYYGQCSELCGVNHGFMPIAIRAVTQEEFDAWVEQAKEQFARVDDRAPQLASAR